jgi:hypothetical protein
MGRSQREKGKRGEREVAQLFRRAEYSAERTRQSEGDHDPDVRVRRGEGHPEIPLWVEVKRHKAIAACRFMDQALEEAHVGYTPAVFLREDEGEWLTMISSEFFLELLTHHPRFKGIAHENFD